MPYHHLLDLAHRVTLDRWAHLSTLFVFDFDGILAPAVNDPTQAKMASDTWSALATLAKQSCVAVVSDRACADLHGRLPPHIRYVIGNHGNEGLPRNYADTDEMTRQCAIWHKQLMADSNLWRDARGALFENKGPSLSLHYRTCVTPSIARSRMLARVTRLTPIPNIIRGPSAIHLLPRQARNKRDAVKSLLQDSACDRAIIIGNDITNEIAFQDAPDNWLTVRVGACMQSEARFFLHDIDEVSKLIRYLGRDRDMADDVRSDSRAHQVSVGCV